MDWELILLVIWPILYCVLGFTLYQYIKQWKSLKKSLENNKSTNSPDPYSRAIRPRVYVSSVLVPGTSWEIRTPYGVATQCVINSGNGPSVISGFNGDAAACRYLEKYFWENKSVIYF